MQDKAPSGQVLSWTSLRVLILDRNDEFRFWLRSVFQGIGTEEIHSTASSADAIHLLRQTAVDVGLVGLAVADGSGLQFLTELRQGRSSPSPNLPVILLTEAGDDKLIHEACEIGVQNLLRKPITEEDLLKRVTRTVLRPKRVVWASTYFGFDRRDKPSFGYLGPQRRTDDNIGEEVPLISDDTEQPGAPPQEWDLSQSEEHPGAPSQEWDLSRSEETALDAAVPRPEPDPEPEIVVPVEPEPPAPEPEPEIAPRPLSPSHHHLHRLRRRLNCRPWRSSPSRLNPRSPQNPRQKGQGGATRTGLMQLRPRRRSRRLHSPTSIFRPF